MAHTVIVHIHNEDPVVAEMEKLPQATDTCVICTELRRRDGKPVHYLAAEATTVIFPLTRVTFIEVLGSETDRGDLVEFFRD